ncbi:MAG: hypothetical protein GYB65_22920 [Chloroflexi bacterium]|nr:hypothetical protein [Chloroflexota bacterium]
MYRYSSFTILNMLVFPYYQPLHGAIQLRWQRRRRRHELSPKTLSFRRVRITLPDGLMTVVEFLLLVLGLQVVIVALGAICTLSFSTTLWAGNVTVAWAGVVTGLLALGSGTAINIIRTNRAITYERARNTWTDLLLLPYDHHQIVLHTVAPAFVPHLLAISGLLAGTSALLLRATPDLRTLIVLVLLTLELFQIMTLCAAIGMTSAAAHRRMPPLIPLALALGLVVLHAGGGWLLAGGTAATPATARAALLIGPLTGVLAHDVWSRALLLAAVYLLALEVLVRGLFAWSITRLSEG